MSQSNTVLARRYAKALFDLALEAGEADGVEADLEVLCSVISTSDELLKALGNPVISRKDLEKLMAALLAKTKARALTQNFITLLARSRRVNILQDVAKEYLALLREQRGEIVATVTTAAALGAAKVTAIEKQLGKTLNRKVKVQTKEDQRILGGVVIKVGSKMLDASLLEKVNRIELLSKKAIASI